MSRTPLLFSGNTALTPAETQTLQSLAQNPQFNAIIRAALQQRATLQNYQVFMFVEKPNADNPFELPLKDFAEFFQGMGKCCGALASGICYAGVSSGATGILLPLAIVLTILLFPFALGSYAIGKLAETMSRENVLANMVRLPTTLAVSGGTTYAIYHNAFPALFNAYMHSLGAQNTTPENMAKVNRLAMGLCHFTCFYIAVTIFAAVVFASGRINLSQCAPSEKLKQMIAKMKNAAMPVGVKFSEAETQSVNAFAEQLITTRQTQGEKKSKELFARVTAAASVQQRAEHTTVSINA